MTPSTPTASPRHYFNEPKPKHGERGLDLSNGVKPLPVYDNWSFVEDNIQVDTWDREVYGA